MLMPFAGQKKKKIPLVRQLFCCFYKVSVGCGAVNGIQTLGLSVQESKL
jgi:hypothetical protein